LQSIYSSTNPVRRPWQQSLPQSLQHWTAAWLAFLLAVVSFAPAYAASTDATGTVPETETAYAVV